MLLLGLLLQELASRGPIWGRQCAATGPRGAGWAIFLSHGLETELDKYGFAVRETGWADTGPQEQVELAEELLWNGKSADCSIGSAPPAEALVSLKRMRDLSPGMSVSAIHFTQAVFWGIMRGRIDTVPFR